jgi:hypothetical protein
MYNLYNKCKTCKKTIFSFSLCYMTILNTWIYNIQSPMNRWKKGIQLIEIIQRESLPQYLAEPVLQKWMRRHIKVLMS